MGTAILGRRWYICKKGDSRGGGSLDAAQWTAI